MKMIEAPIPVEIKQQKSGLFFVTSPLIKGLLVSERTEAAALQAARHGIADLGRAAAETAGDGQ